MEIFHKLKRKYFLIGTNFIQYKSIFSKKLRLFGCSLGQKRSFFRPKNTRKVFVLEQLALKARRLKCIVYNLAHCKKQVLGKFRFSKSSELTNNCSCCLLFLWFQNKFFAEFPIEYDFSVSVSINF